VIGNEIDHMINALQELLPWKVAPLLANEANKAAQAMLFAGVKAFSPNGYFQPCARRTPSTFASPLTKASLVGEETLAT
jgi:hypothetical protein